MTPTSGWRVRVPASSANLGPGFDALGMALATYLVVEPGEPAASETHPCVVAYRRGGGEGPISVTAGFPAGRGLGFSGAARVAGLIAARVSRGEDPAGISAGVLEAAADLEGHADNVAASLYGGIVVTAGSQVVRVPLALEASAVVWVPPSSTSTKASRGRLPDQVAFDDAVFNVGRVALLVASLAAGVTGTLRAATQDRLHQDFRLTDRPEARAAIEAALEAGAWGAWLSGSGPSVAALCDPLRASEVVAALPGGGQALVLPIDRDGAVVERGERGPQGAGPKSTAG